jgi:hypothetical protein
MTTKAKLLGLALGLAATISIPSAAQARDCRDRIHHEEHELDRAIAKHGYYSRQAEHERQELARLRALCGDERYRHDWDRDRY